jgi:hypothetical protein
MPVCLRNPGLRIAMSDRPPPSVLLVTFLSIFCLNNQLYSPITMEKTTAIERETKTGLGWGLPIGFTFY